MYKKDQLKIIAVLIILGAVAIGFYIGGKESAKYIALAGVICWFVIMYTLNTRQKKP